METNVCTYSNLIELFEKFQKKKLKELESSQSSDSDVQDISSKYNEYLENVKEYIKYTLIDIYDKYTLIDIHDNESNESKKSFNWCWDEVKRIILNQDSLKIITERLFWLVPENDELKPGEEPIYIIETNEQFTDEIKIIKVNDKINI